MLLGALGALALAAWVAAAVAFVLGVSGPVEWLEAASGPLCHHLSERTLHVGGRPLPVCARCTGLWTAVAVGGPLGWAVAGKRSRLGRAFGVAAVSVGLGLSAALAEWGGLIATPNGARLLLGGLLGVGAPLVAGLGARVLWDGDPASARRP